MPIYRVHLSFPMDSTLPRDAVQITPHFFGDNPSALANALKTNLIARPAIASATPFTIKVYDAQKPPPSYPLATASQTGTPKVNVAPRELALCLSYFAGDNRPRFRGRLYLPPVLLGITPGSLRPNAGQMTAALDFAKVFYENIPAPAKWHLYSPTDNRSLEVTDAWVDDEWDIVRSRGLRGTTRQSVIVP